MVGISLYFINPDLFFQFSRDIAMATNFWQTWQNDLHLTCWHFEMD